MKINFNKNIINFLGKNFNLKINNKNNINLNEYKFDFTFYITNAKINLTNDKIIIDEIILEHKTSNKILICSLEISSNNCILTIKD